MTASTHDWFSRLDRKITAPKSETDKAMERAIDCAWALNEHYYSPGKRLANQMTLLGSLAKGTSRTPMADADVLFHMPAGTYGRFDAYSGNGQSALLQEVRGVLREHYPRTDIRGDGPVVVVAFTSGVNVEVVPGVLFDGVPDALHAHCQVPVTRDGGSWEDSEYGAEYEALRRVNEPRQGQIARLIRYMKAWRVAQDVTFKSLVIELMAVDFARTWPTNQSSYTYDDWLVRDFLAYAVDHYYTTYRMPGTGKQIDTGYGWWQAAKDSAESARKACLYGPDSVLYGWYWREVFGDGFGS